MIDKAKKALNWSEQAFIGLAVSVSLIIFLVLAALLIVFAIIILASKV
jgi:flagellar biosynthesis/type III secretory pathway M-ring protein FliF/YscJ